ncbi:MAG: hypothetical protein P8K79_07755 [Mariniblastus sp.]|nr:hypothetical protein [Mariniblastus sp.]
MRKPNLDFKTFLLYHVEKVILLIAVIFLALFFWWGYTTPVFNEKTPSQMQQMASQANGYIENNESWNKIAEHRHGDDDSHVRIEQASKVFIETDQYKHGRLLGTKAKALGMRSDPVLRAPIDIVAVPFYVPLLINNKEGLDMAVSALPLANKNPDEEDENDPGGGRGGPGDLGDFGGSSGDDEEKKKRVDGVQLGEVMPEIQAQYMPGIRPKKEKLSASKHRPEVTKVMAIFGLVEFKNQWAEYDKVLQDSTAYYPARDKPIYQYVEVQRREKGQPDDAWIDVSKRSRKIANDFFPDSIYQYGAPEVIDARFFDPILTGKIPPISMVDYRDLATHPNGKVAPREFPKITGEDDGGSKTKPGQGSSLEDFKVDEDDEEDLDVPQQGEDSTEGRGGRDGQGGSDLGEGYEDENPGNSDIQKETTQKRKGSDRSDYIEIMKAKAASGDYKLLRFFDIAVPEGKEFEYRVRVWLADPNNENPDGLLSALADATEGGRDTPSAGMTGMEGGDEEGPGMGQQEDESDNYQYVKLESTMKDPAVRARITKLEKEIKANPKILPNKFLQYARPTEWASTPGAVNSPKDLGEFYAGRVVAGRQIRVNNSFYVPTGDPSAEVVTVVWDDKYHTQIPAHRVVKTGDVLNFKPEKAVHLLHPIDWSVRKLEDPDELKTDAVVIDILGGEALRISQSKMDFNLPGEILIMDAAGNFRVQNDVKDRLDYRHALFLDDELSEVGKKKKKKDEDMFGGGEGGGDGPGQ